MQIAKIWQFGISWRMQHGFQHHGQRRELPTGLIRLPHTPALLQETSSSSFTQEIHTPHPKHYWSILIAFRQNVQSMLVIPESFPASCTLGKRGFDKQDVPQLGMIVFLSMKNIVLSPGSGWVVERERIERRKEGLNKGNTHLLFLRGSGKSFW